MNRPVENKELLNKAKSGDNRALLLIINDLEGFIHTVCKKSANPAIQFDDLKQIAAEAIILSLKKFDPNYGTKFITYAGASIKHAIWAYCNKQNQYVTGEEFEEEAFNDTRAETVLNLDVIKKQLSAIDPKLSKVVYDRYLNNKGLSWKEVGKLNNITYNRAEAWSSRAIKLIKSNLETTKS